MPERSKFSPAPQFNFRCRTSCEDRRPQTPAITRADPTHWTQFPLPKLQPHSGKTGNLLLPKTIQQTPPVWRSSLLIVVEKKDAFRSPSSKPKNSADPKAHAALDPNPLL
jgi:hypothetical protein